MLQKNSCYFIDYLEQINPQNSSQLIGPNLMILSAKQYSSSVEDYVHARFRLYC